jgi:hypothetical protein
VLSGDALDLRHRLRLIWAAMLAGQAPAYQARHIATATRHLTKDQAAFVDARLAPSLGAVSWLWRSPHGRIYLVNATGTHPVGDSQFAQAIWRAASQPQKRAAELTTTTLC